MTIYDLPNESRIEKNTFKLRMCTFNVGLHFKSILKIKDEYYLFDDLIDGLSSDIKAIIQYQQILKKKRIGTSFQNESPTVFIQI